MEEAIKRLRSIGERGMMHSDYRDVTDSLSLYRQDLELVLSIYKDVTRYFELNDKLSEPVVMTNDELNEYFSLNVKLAKVDKELEK